MKEQRRVLIVDCTGDFEKESAPMFSSFALKSTRVPSCMAAIETVKEETFKMIVMNLREGLHDECYRKFYELRTLAKCAILIGVYGSSEFASMLRIELLASGADVVLNNPLNKELAYQSLAIMRCIVKYSSGRYCIDDDLISVQGLEILIPFRHVYVEGIRIHLPVKEFNILLFLAGSPWIVRTYEEIYISVWQFPYEYISHEIIWSHVSRLRILLKVSPQSLNFIRNIKGIGYSFEPPHLQLNS